MTKRTQSATRRSSSTVTTSPATPSADVLADRVLALAEQLGRIAGTVQAKAAGWMDADALKKELTRVRDGAADLLQELTGDAEAAPAVAKKKTTAAASRSQGRSGGVVDAPGKKHRPLMPTDPGAKRAESQAAKMRAAKTMVKTPRHRGRG